MNTSDVKLLVHSFYEKVRHDDLLAPIFNSVINDRWEEHLSKMVAFWDTVLFEKRTYFGKPFVPHSRLPVNKTHFLRWQCLFVETVDSYFIGQKAEEAKWRASKMAVLFLHRIEQLRNDPARSVIQ